MIFKIISYFCIALGIFMIILTIIGYFMLEYPLKEVFLSSLVSLIPIFIGLIMNGSSQLMKKK